VRDARGVAVGDVVELAVREGELELADELAALGPAELVGPCIWSGAMHLVRDQICSISRWRQPSNPPESTLLPRWRLSSGV
jgi:hypothetical protein